MRMQVLFGLVGLLAGAGVVVAVDRLHAPAPPAAVDAAPSRPDPSTPAWNSPIQPIASLQGQDPALVALGRRLFHEPRLSKDGSVSCASCHDLAAGGDDGRPVSIGVGQAAGALNAPTVLNAALNFRQFWDGRAESLEEQVDGPILHPSEMGMTWPDVVARLAADPSYVEEFRAVFGGGPDADRVRAAIAAFERSLLTPDSPFDRWLLGDAAAISDQARAGYRTFVEIGCITCHQGMNVGGNMFQHMGRMQDYFAASDAITAADLGRFNVTGKERDRHVFKVPSLRNVELTAPYFHDGSAATLEEAVRIMAEYQLGTALTEQELAGIVAFLRTLTGRQPAIR